MGRMILLICAVVVAVFLSGLAQPVQPQQQPAAADQPAKAAEKTSQQRPPIMITLSEANGERQEDQQSTDDQAGQSEPSPWLDLIAQSLMALWALLQLGLTGVGIWYIRRTLVETEKAVGEAAKGTTAAQKAVTETSRVGEAQVRAYLSVIGLNYTATPEKAQMLATPGIEIVLNNSGATPAINVAHYCGCGVATQFAARTFECPEIIPFTTRLPTMPANATERREAWCHGIINRVSEYKTADLMVSQDTKFGNMPILLMWGSVLYDDVFGASHRSDYAFVVHHRDGLVNHPLSVADAPQRCFQPISDRRAVVQKAED